MLLNLFPNPYQNEIGFRQGQIEISYDRNDDTTTSLHIPSAVIERSTSMFTTIH